MRFPKPFFRQSKQAWYLQLGKRQVSLGKDREAAFARYRQLLLHEQGQGAAANSELTVAEVCDLFLEFSQRSHDAETYQWYRRFLSDFCGQTPALRTSELKPFHVTRWLQKKKTWGSTSQNRAIGCVKRALNWSVGEGLLTDNPLRLLKKPPMKRRERYLKPEERRTIFAAANGKAFKTLLFALGQTGARPGEITKVTAADIDFERGVWVIRKHKTAKKTGKPRIVYLSPAMLRLSRKLVAKNPTGPIFRNARGLPWCRNAIRMRFRQLRRKLGLDAGVVAYCYRHAFITDALAKGMSDATVAELVGHVSTEMIHRHYSHLDEKRDLLRAAAAQAVAHVPPRTP